jgi:dihydroorotate dehydrogenase electron transfer subunit
VKAHQFLDVIGPIGKAFAYPAKLSGCLLVAEGHGSAPLYFLGQELRARGRRVDMLVGAETEDQVFKPIEAKRLSQSIVITTDDGSFGEAGSVLDHLPEVVESTGAQVIYAAGRRSTLRRIAEFCAERQIPSQIAVEEEMACGIGLCFSCAVPVIRKDGSGYDNLRACVDGPVFNPARILWDRWLGEDQAQTVTPPEGFPVLKAWPG